MAVPQEIGDIEKRIQELFEVTGATQSISSAWEVVDKLAAMGFNFYLWRELRIWSCAVDQSGWRVAHLEAPVAICKAAIRAYEENPQGLR